MALSAKFSLLHSEFNDFLFAQMAEEESGAPLTVLSALTRLSSDSQDHRRIDCPLVVHGGDLPVDDLVEMLSGREG
jgi:hypothetical protein